MVLNQAFVWVCPGCDTKNFAESQQFVLDEHDIEKLGEYGYSIPVGSQVILAPKEVACMLCGATYETASRSEI